MLTKLCFFFFFSSRRRHTRCLSDWSSDVCSSDLVQPEILVEAAQHQRKLLLLILPRPMPMLSEPLLGFGQELSAAFDARNPHQGKLASLIGAAHMRKT